jgi:Xaa-Pro aminopeptidase
VTGLLPSFDLPPAPDVGSLVEARRTRLGRFRGLLRDSGLTTGLVARPALIRHLTGVRSAVGALVVSPDDAWLVALDGSFGFDTVAAVGIGVVSAPAYDRDAFVDPAASVASAAANELASRRPTCPIGADVAHLPAAIVAALVEPPVDIGPLLEADRRHKDPVELDGLRRAVAVVERAFADAAAVARPGGTERDLFQAISESIYRDVGDDAQLAANISSGERTAHHDPHATERELRAGDLVLLDVYPVVEGYVADLTRTWVIGEAPATLRERHDALVAALGSGASAIGEGTTGTDIDLAVRDSLKQRLGPLAGSMRHHTGHGIGIDGWERPWLGADSADQIGPGTVVCIEPGVYEPGVGGLRLEGEFLLGESGVERLDSFPDELLELPA